MSSGTTSAGRPNLMQMLFGFFPAQVVFAAADLGVADQLASGEAGATEVAAACGTQPDATRRLLRAMVVLGLATEPEPDRYDLTDEGDLLRSGAPGSMRNFVRLFCSPEVWRSWGGLTETVRTGETAWNRIFGASAFEYFADHPDVNAIFNEAMAEGTRVAIPGIVAVTDLTNATTVVDVGGGNGALLAGVLDAHPHLSGVLFDTALGVEDAPQILGAAGVTGRCRIGTGNFFDSVPADGDAYLLKSVIHDWDDERSLAILRSCRNAMPDHARLHLVEPIMPATMRRDPSLWGMSMSDINMLVCVGGRERTEDEFEKLLDGAGFDVEVVQLCPPPTSYSVITACPAT